MWTPGVLYHRFGLVVPKARDCGDHEWHVSSSEVERCYHCLAERPAVLWDEFDTRLEYGKGEPRLTVAVDIRLSLESAARVGLRDRVEISTSMAPADALVFAERLRADAERAAQRNDETSLT
jgi:hypothetical protein